MTFDAKAARAATHQARVDLTVEANIDAVKEATRRGQRFTYAVAPFKEDAVRSEANARLQQLGFETPSGYVQW